MARALLFVAVAIAVVGAGQRDDAFARGGSQRGPLQGLGSLGQHGERALERLPWPVHVVSANLSREIPMSIAGCYLMEKQLLVLGTSGKVYCLDRRDLEPRWVNSLRYPLAAPPAEGPTHYAFLMKDHKGAHWVYTISKRSGSASDRFPVRLRYSASSAISVNGSMVFIGSLGSPGNNKTVETVNLVTGRRGWTYSSTGMVWGRPSLDPSGRTLILAGDDGRVTALRADASAPSTETWIKRLGGGIRGAPAVTPADVLVGNDDGVLYCLDINSGSVKWLQGLDQRIRTSPWVLGGFETVQQGVGVPGAKPIEVRRYEGVAFARNVLGLHAFDLRSGKPLFKARGGRPLARHGKYLLTIDGRCMVTIRDATKNYEVVGTMRLAMFDLLPTNGGNGEIFAATADGFVVGAIPK